MDKNNPDNICPSNRQEWRLWLRENHLKEESVWVIFHKKSSTKTSMSWAEAVEEALCFGWIDSIRKSIDSEKFIQYFAKRKPGSTWSKINKDKVEYLINEGLMAQAGLESIETARKNGSWNMLDEVEALIIPDDLYEAFSGHPGSLEFFEGLSKSGRKIILSWIVLARRSETRAKRIQEVAISASQGTMPKQLG